ncbi:MAG: FtsW/RodA/SpoVE family cell cycle protein [Candidatus Nanopelagicales bacterium]
MSVPTTVPAAELTAPKRRGVEATLLVAALVVGAFAYASVDLSLNGALPVNFWAEVGAFAGLLAVAHIGVRILAPYADPYLLPIVAMLNMLGLAMIHRLDLADEIAARRNGTELPRADADVQFTWMVLAVAMFILTLLIVRDHRRLQRFTYTAMFLGVALLLLPLVPGLGANINGATLWIRLGPFSFQPSEFAKILLTIFFAGYLVLKRDSMAVVRTKILGIGIPRPRDLGPLLVAWAAALVVLAVQRDLGTALMFFGVFVVMVYVATGRRSWLVIGALLLVTGALIAWSLFSHVQLRVNIWLDTWTYATDESFQLAQGLMGLANGGLFGSGLGNGYPQFVPFAKSDFIADALGEEVGLTGMFAILLLYAMAIERGLRTAIAVRDNFGKLLAVGLSTVLALQLFVVVGGVTRLIPLTGLTTPFLAYGGSALLANWVMVALLLRISHRAREPIGQVPLASPSGAAAVTP